jgi:hypothetical protein
MLVIIESAQHTTLKPSRITGATLGNPNDLALPLDDFTRPQTGKAHHFG